MAVQQRSINLESLEERKKKELEFHNLHRDLAFAAGAPKDTYELLHGNKKYYSVVEKSHRYIDEWFQKHIPGKVFFDYACGNGEMAIKAASMGSALAIGLDISDVSVGNARKAAEKLGVADRCIFVQGDCENTGLPNGCADVILCSGMLHHLDLKHAFPELERVLGSGGRILCIEALAYNPIIKLYRLLTPSMRTEWEKNHILSMRDVRFAGQFFNFGEVRYWHLLSIMAVPFRNFMGFKPMLSLLGQLDDVVLRVPGLRLLAWQFTFELLKKPE
ncbi:MAG TPA: class I SAM-dependent methyltransferase [Bdellovibrionota bacterium]|nr:class I SAM-dependent methyltransferase [Bdellovibrionota bacterium]